jgi:predicted RNA binding protein YcfA (HicA-like mRNA interferase family)
VGSHVRLTHPGPPERHLTIPRHDELKVGTLKAILDDLGEAWKLDRIQVLQRLLKR